MAALRPGERIELVRLLKKVGLAAAKRGENRIKAEISESNYAGINSRTEL